MNKQSKLKENVRQFKWFYHSYMTDREYGGE